MFTDGEHTFMGDEHKFADGEHKFTHRKHKIYTKRLYFTGKAPEELRRTSVLGSREYAGDSR